MTLLDRFNSREDFHQSVQYAAVMEGIGWCSLPVSGSRFAIRPVGPVALSKMQRPKVIDVRKIRALCRKLHVVHFIVEPSLKSILIDQNGKKHTLSFVTEADQHSAKKMLSQAGLHLTKERYAHSKTALVDLSPPMEDVILKFPAKTRYNIKLSKRSGVSYESISFANVSAQVKQDFFTLHSRWSKEKHILGFSNSFLDTVMHSFPTKGWLIKASMGEEFMGAMMVLLHDRIGYYFYTCTSEQGKLQHVPTGLTYEAMKLAKDNGADIFDFCSVYDERYPNDHPRWKGFTTFKERFHPIPLYYPPSFGRWL